MYRMYRHTQRLSAVLLFWLLTLYGLPVEAQAPTPDSVQINYLDDSQPVQITAYVSVLRQGQALPNLPADAFAAFVDDQQLPAESVAVEPVAPGLAVAVLVDISGSMDEPGLLNERRLLDARQLARDFVQTLNEEDWVAVLLFASEVTTALNLTYDHGAALNTLQQLPDLAGDRAEERREYTHLFDAVMDAVNLLTDNPDVQVREQTAAMRKAVVVFSDGNDTLSQASRPEAQRIANEHRVSAYAITLCSPEGRGDPRFRCQSDDVRWLATRTSGEFVAFEQADDRAVVQALYERLGNQRNQYRVTFGWHAARGLHKCRVEVTIGNVMQGDEMECSSRLMPPEISIVAPADGTSYARSETGPVEVAIQLGFPDGIPRDPEKIEYFVNGNLHQTIEEPSWKTLPTVVWNTEELPGGDYTLLAVVHDPWTETQSDSQRVRVSIASFEPPTITLTSSTNQVIATASAAVTLTVDAQFPDGAPRPVELSLRDEGHGELAQATGLPPFQVIWPVHGVGAGQHILVAEVLDPATQKLIRSPETTIQVKLTPADAIVAFGRDNWYWLLSLVVFAVLITVLWRRKPVVLSPITTQLKSLTTRLSPNPPRARLVVLRGPQLGEYSIREQITTIGRDGDLSTIVIAGDPTVSRVHATIQMDPTGKFYIRNDSTTNPTYLNSQQVPGQPHWTPLNDGDVIVVGQTQLQFHVLGKTTQRLPPTP